MAKAKVTKKEKGGISGKPHIIGLASDLIPTTLFNPLLSRKAVISRTIYNGSDIENLLRALKKRIKQWERRVR